MLKRILLSETYISISMKNFHHLLDRKEIKGISYCDFMPLD